MHVRYIQDIAKLDDTKLSSTQLSVFLSMAMYTKWHNPATIVCRSLIDVFLVTAEKGNSSI